jgi:hypothetical protein
VVGICLLLSQLAWSGIVGEIKIGPDSVKFTFPSTYDSLAKSVKRRKLSYDTLVDDFDRDGKPDRFVRVYADLEGKPTKEERRSSMEGLALYSGGEGLGIAWAVRFLPDCFHYYRCIDSWRASRGSLFWHTMGGFAHSSDQNENQYRFHDGKFWLIGAIREDEDEDGSERRTWNLVTGRYRKVVEGKFWVTFSSQEWGKKVTEGLLVLADGNPLTKESSVHVDSGAPRRLGYRLIEGDSVRVLPHWHGDTIWNEFTGKVDSVSGSSRQIRNVRSTTSDSISEFVFVFQSEKQRSRAEGIPNGVDFQAFRNGKGAKFRVLKLRDGGLPVLDRPREDRETEAPE